MSLILRCPNCHSKIKAPDKAKGRTITCPDCNQPFVVKSSVIVDDDTIVPPTPVPMPVSAPTAPVTAQPLKLINCPACGKSISPAAKDCPGCGNPNKYVHPEIQRFQDAARSTFSQTPQFNYKVEGFNLSGWAAVEKGASKATGRSYFTCKPAVPGLITMSYFGKVAERCSRASYGLISLDVRRTPLGYIPSRHSTVG